MTEVNPRGGSQLDRIDSKLDQVLDRLTRMEERQDSHGGKIQAHDARLDEHASRLRDVEIAHAVSAATGQQGHQQLKGRWAAIGATALVILGSVGAFIGNTIIKLFHIGS
ncbi:hypothetical protein [uncultured Halomonas sp.]|uniref:hypothetical protein n=1 Tax=uncultured Halomonas sp. TaxID=173971 RepID=UPI00260B1454|nr:hypothetical protein [uncultured Halomonas sp.]